MNEAAERSRIEITQFFNEIRKAISERETIMKQKLSEELRKQEHLLKKKEENVNKHLKNVLIFYEEYEKSLSEKEIPLLNSSLKRIETIKKATLDVEKFEVFDMYTGINKENELNILWKMIQPLKSSKESLHGQSQGNKKERIPQIQSHVLKSKAAKARNSVHMKKDSNYPSPLPQGVSSHSFAFSVVDKNGNKLPLRNKEVENVENKRYLSFII